MARHPLRAKHSEASVRVRQYVQVIEPGAEAFPPSSPDPPYPPSSRDPLPRGECYPVGRQALDAALASAGVSDERLGPIGFLRGGQKWHGGQGRVVQAYFQAATRDWPAERVDLLIYAVPTRLKRAIATALSDGMLTRVAKWIADIAAAGNAWRASDHRLDVRWTGHDIQVEEFHGTAARPW